MRQFNGTLVSSAEMDLFSFRTQYSCKISQLQGFFLCHPMHFDYTAFICHFILFAIFNILFYRSFLPQYETVYCYPLSSGVCFMSKRRQYSDNARNDYNAFWHVLRIIGFCLSFGNSCANPIALYFVSAAFRKHFNR